MLVSVLRTSGGVGAPPMAGRWASECDGTGCFVLEDRDRLPTVRTHEASPFRMLWPGGVHVAEYTDVESGPEPRWSATPTLTRS
jgi:hypothetical protein